MVLCVVIDTLMHILEEVNLCGCVILGYVLTSALIFIDLIFQHPSLVCWWIDCILGQHPSILNHDEY